MEIGRGEFYALMGRNGSGKTTLISIITCTSLPTRGSARILGYDVVDEADEVKRLIGYVPQENFSCPRLTGRENLVYFARLFRFPKREAEALAGELLERMGLAKNAGRYVSEYSGGMRKRLEGRQTLRFGSRHRGDSSNTLKKNDGEPKMAYYSMI